MTVVGCLVTVIVSDLGKAICDFATATKRAPKTDEDLATVIYEDWAIPIVQEVILTVGQVNLTAYPMNLAADDQRLWVEGWCWCVGPDLTRERG